MLFSMCIYFEFIKMVLYYESYSVFTFLAQHYVLVDDALSILSLFLVHFAEFQSLYPHLI